MDLTCSTCGQAYDPDRLQETHPYRHPVNGPLQAQPKDDTPQFPTDPILRLALIRAGVITAKDLTEAEEELKATGVAIAE